jgi:hypothetical protein
MGRVAVFPQVRLIPSKAGGGVPSRDQAAFVSAVEGPSFKIDATQNADHKIEP